MSDQETLAHFWALTKTDYFWVAVVGLNFVIGILSALVIRWYDTLRAWAGFKRRQATTKQRLQFIRSVRALVRAPFMIAYQRDRAIASRVVGDIGVMFAAFAILSSMFLGLPGIQTGALLAITLLVQIFSLQSLASSVRVRRECVAASQILWSRDQRKLYMRHMAEQVARLAAERKLQKPGLPSNEDGQSTGH